MDDAEARQRRRRLTMLLVPIGCLVVCSYVGSALFPTLSVNHPLLLIMLDARNRHLVAVTNQLDAFSYYTVGTLRLLLSDPLFYLLGYWYGERALAYMDEKAGSFGRFLRGAERFFTKASYPLVFLAPNNYFCLFAGASRMPPAVFLVLNVSGTLARLAVIRVVGDVFKAPIDDVLGFIRHWQIPLTVLTIVLVGVQVLVERRRGGGELTELRELEQVLEDEDPGPGPESEPPAQP